MQSNTNKLANAADDKQEKEYQHKSWSDWAEIIARWVVDVFAIPASFTAAVLAQFFDHKGSGKKILGAVGFWGGTFFDADGTIRRSILCQNSWSVKNA
jgi:hypothetical protein